MKLNRKTARARKTHSVVHLVQLRQKVHRPFFLPSSSTRRAFLVRVDGYGSIAASSTRFSAPPEKLAATLSVIYSTWVFNKICLPLAWKIARGAGGYLDIDIPLICGMFVRRWCTVDVPINHLARKVCDLEKPDGAITRHLVNFSDPFGWTAN